MDQQPVGERPDDEIVADLEVVEFEPLEPDSGGPYGAVPGPPITFLDSESTEPPPTRGDIY